MYLVRCPSTRIRSLSFWRTCFFVVYTAEVLFLCDASFMKFTRCSYPRVSCTVSRYKVECPQPSEASSVILRACLLNFLAIVSCYNVECHQPSEASSVILLAGLLKFLAIVFCYSVERPPTL